MKFNKADIVGLKGVPGLQGVITKFLDDGSVVVWWWPCGRRPQSKTFVDMNRLELIQSSQKKRGRPPKSAISK